MKMVILDTSIWIEYFKRNTDYTSVIDNLLRKRKVLALDFIFGELLQVAKEHEINKITGIWEILPKVNIENIGYFAGKYSIENNLFDKGVGLIDSAIMYAAIQTESLLGTLDKKILHCIEGKYLYTFK
jgi:predicted nucleic acid-binding protein